MNKKEFDNFMLAANKYRNIGVNIDFFCNEFLQGDLSKYMTPITEREISQIGLYGTINNAKIYVCKIFDQTKKYSIHIYNPMLDQVFSKNDQYWTIALELETLDKIIDRSFEDLQIYKSFI